MDARLPNLKADYSTVYKMLVNERAMRDHVFRHDETKRRVKLQEVDHALKALDRIKDMAKVLLTADGATEAEQGSLFDGGKE